jgi:RimJ/RimL family protein N-acetyltransferase
MYRRNAYLIRNVEDSDATILHELQNDEYVYSHLIEIRMTSLSSDKQFAINPAISDSLKVVQFEKNVIGRLRISYLTGFKDVCEVGLDIRENYRGQGHAANVYKLLHSYLYQYRNVRKVYLRVLSGNKHAEKIYQNLGYNLSGSYPGYLIRNGCELDYLLYHRTLSNDDVWSSHSGL